MTLLKHIKQVAFCASIAFLAFSCQKEDDTLQVQQTALKSNVNISRLNTKAIENDKNLMRIINKAETKRIESKANKTVYNAQYDFTINTNYAKVITNSNGLKNYTFGVYRTEDNGLLENLLLQEQEDHSFKVSLVQYSLTPNERNALANREIVDVEDKITYITLEDISDTIFDKVNSDAETCTVYSYEWEAGNLCDSGLHDYADGVACDYWDNPDKAATSGGWVLTSNETSCGDGGGSTNTDSNPNSNPNGSNQTTSNGGGIVLEPNTTPVLCPECPVISEEDNIDCPPVPNSVLTKLTTVFGEGNFEYDCSLNSNETIDVSSVADLEELLDELLLSETVEVEIPSVTTGFLREDKIVKKFSSFPQTTFVAKMKMQVPNSPVETLKLIYADVGLEGNLTLHDWTQTDNGDPLQPDGVFVETDFDLNSYKIKIDGEMLVGINIDGYPFRSKKYITFIVTYDLATNMPLDQYCYWIYVN